jgi:hypothetical protein
MSQNEESDREPTPELHYVHWRGSGHPFQVRSRFGTQHREAWARSANSAAADVAESHTFKLRNAEGDVYLFTPDPFDYSNVWVRNKGVKLQFTTAKARELWKELITSKGYVQAD